MNNKLPCDRCLRKLVDKDTHCLAERMLPDGAEHCPYFKPMDGDKE